MSQLPNLQIGKTTNSVAAGESLEITTASGEVISATAITPIRSGTVAFQYLNGRWVAIDFTVNAITSRKHEARRTRPRLPPIPELVYPFKGLVRFTDDQLYKGGDNNITRLDIGVYSYGIKGFANLGLNVLDIVAIWQKNNDLLIQRNASVTTISGWFLQGYRRSNVFIGYDNLSRWRGPNFYGFNGYGFDRTYTSSTYYGNSWGFDITVEPWDANLPGIPIPTVDRTRLGVQNDIPTGETEYPLMYQPAPAISGQIQTIGTWTYTDDIQTTKNIETNESETGPLISTNLGQTTQGGYNYNGTMTINFQKSYSRTYTEPEYIMKGDYENEYYYAVWSELYGGYIGGATNYLFERNISGTRSGQVTDTQSWTIYLSETIVVPCSYQRTANYGGTLNIENRWSADLLAPDEDTPDEGSRREMTSKDGGILEASVFPVGSATATIFTQSATTTKDEIINSDVTQLWLSGKDCYIYTEKKYSSSYTGTASHSNDTDKVINKSYGQTYQYHPNTEDDYWYIDVGKTPERTLIGGETSWFVTMATESWDRSSYSPSIPDKVVFVDTKSSRLIEMNQNSVAIFVYDMLNTLSIGQSITCNNLDLKLIAGPLIYEAPLKYTRECSASSRTSPLTQEITVEKWSDDAIANQIMNSISSRDYDFIWKEGTNYYIGAITITGIQSNTINLETEIDNTVIGRISEDPRIETYVIGKQYEITQITFTVDSKSKINASLFSTTGGVIVSRDNYASYIASFMSLIHSSPPGQNYPKTINLFLRDNPILATTNIPTASEITSNRTMYAEILELLPDGRWVRREEESGDVTGMPLGTPETTSDIWSYYKE